MSRLAILEDHAMVLDALRARLLAHYVDATIVFEGASVSEARSSLSQASADCLIMDLDLGDGNSGPQNVAELIDLGIPIVIVSALGDGPTVRRAIEAGAAGYVSKQGQFDELVQAIDAAMRGEQYMSADIAKAFVSSPTVSLSDQERTALVLYASGLKMSAVARRMGVSEPTINEYIKRVRAKHSNAGNPLPTKVHLYRLAQSEGWLD